MVTHVGSSVHFGHYTAVAQTSTGHSYQFYDSSVQPISLSAVLDTNAYIMMYEREPEVPSVPQKCVVSAAATIATCAVNGQKTSVSAQVFIDNIQMNLPFIDCSNLDSLCGDFFNVLQSTL
jgi:hypothetical protein